jgi:uncharacterized RDD family membrane protein YckC
MTAPQQPPWGYYPPPPPPPVWVLPQQAYTPWLTRFCAFLIDVVPAMLVLVIGSMVGELAVDCATVRPGVRRPGCGWAQSGNGGTVLVLILGGTLALWALTLAYLVWNLGYRQGTTGSSIGKSVMKFKVVGEKTWQPIGFGMSLVRQLVHWVDQMICYVGFLWPLWDKKRQTFADMIMSTVCVPRDAPPPPAPAYPPAGYPWPG